MSKHKFPYKWNLSDGYPAKGIEHHGCKVFGTFICGGGSSMGYKLAGFDHLGGVEIDPPIADVYKVNHKPKHLYVEDIRDFNKRKDLPAELYDLDLLDGSPPCFVKGTLVMTDNGLVPIDKLKVGNKVLTHKNRFRPVVSLMQKEVATLYDLKVQGSGLLKVTGEHPFYVRTMKRAGKENERTFGPPEWKDVKDLMIVKNSSNTTYEQDYTGVAINQKSEVPQWGGVNLFGALVNTLDLNSKDFWYIIGRWIGDGWTRTFKNKASERLQPKYQPEQGPCQNCGNPSRRHGRYKTQWTAYCSEKCRKQYGKQKRKPNRNDFIICCNKAEENEMRSRFDSFGWPYRVSEQRTVFRFVVSSKELCAYVSQFGNRSHNKHLTSDVLNLPTNLLESFLDGYLAADGHFDSKRGKWGCASVSPKLIFGIQHCIHKVFKTPTSLSLKDNSKYASVIEGRDVKTRTAYTLQFFKEPKKQQHAFYEAGYLWVPFRSKKQVRGQSIVYNVSVEDDESYTVNNLICHNCSSFSMAGNREKDWGKSKVFREGQAMQTLDDLFFDYIALAKRLQPKVVLAENVKGLIQGNAKAYVRKIKKGFEDAGYKVQLFLLNAASMGVPQKRERVFFICQRKDLGLPKLELGFSEAAITFGDARAGLQKNGKPEWIRLTDFQRNIWEKAEQGENFAKYNNGNGFNDYKAEDGVVHPTLSAQQHKYYHSTEPRHLYQSEFCALGSYPQDYSFKDNKPGYLIGMSVPPVMTAQIAHQIYLQWLSKIKDDAN